MGNETMSEVTARNAAAEKAMADAIQTLEEALSDAAGLPEFMKAEVYAERLGAVRGILGKFIRRSMIDILAEDHGGLAAPGRRRRRRSDAQCEGMTDAEADRLVYVLKNRTRRFIQAINGSVRKSKD